MPDPGLTVSTAKLHILHLEPIKERLGPRWQRLSALVHKLFETALKRAQSPYDHFVLTGELSYIATFHNLSLDEAALACAAVAKEVCELLFGEDVESISMRCVVGSVSAEHLKPTADIASVTDILEQGGREVIITGDAASREIASFPKRQDKILTARTSDAYQLLRMTNHSAAFFPLWDVQKNISNTLLLSACTSGSTKIPISARRIGFEDDEQCLEIEIALLRAASAYTEKLHTTQKVCAVGVGVSYETLSGFNTRISYIGAIKAIATYPGVPLLLKIERVPSGVPLGRLAELIAMLSALNFKVLVEFSLDQSLPDINVRLGAAGLGISIPRGCPPEATKIIMPRLVREAVAQRAFSYVTGVAHVDTIEDVKRSAVRFVGLSGGDRSYSGSENVPEFPITREIATCPSDNTILR